MSAESESIDLRELGAALRRGWRSVAIGVGVGLALAVLVLFTVRPRYHADGTILLRTQQGGAGSLVASGESSEDGSALGGLAEMFSLDSGFETEMAILGSRSVVGEVVDSLGLQARVLEPWRTGAHEILASATYPRDFEEGEFEFERAGEGYRVRGEGFAATVAPGERFEVRGAVLQLRPSGLPESFTLEITDYQSAVQRVLKVLGIERAGGNVAELAYRDLDPVTAAAVPNAVIDVYMRRRTTTDRSINQRRYEFLDAHTDTITLQLAAATEELRRHQEQSGVLSPEIQTEAEVEQAMALVARRQELEVDARALGQVLQQGAQGTLTATSIASYPTLIQNGAVNHLLARLTDLEARRTELSDRRTDEDPDLQLLEMEIADTRARIVEIARSYHAGVTRQLTQVERELGRSQAQLTSMPARVQRSFELERDVERLSETLVALQTQLVQARIAAIAEGGNLRQIDQAEPPRQPLYPRAPLTLALGLFGGLFFGVVGALGGAGMSRRVTDAVQLQRLTGLPVIPLRPGAPLLVANMDTARSLLVLAADAGTRTAEPARQIAATATLRGRAVVLADLEEAEVIPGPTPTAAGTAIVHEPSVSEALERVQEPLGGAYQLFRPNGNIRAGVRPLMAELEDRTGLVVAALPPIDRAVSAALLENQRPVVLVARAHQTRRSELEATLDACGRLGVEVVGIILANGQEGSSS